LASARNRHTLLLAARHGRGQLGRVSSHPDQIQKLYGSLIALVRRVHVAKVHGQHYILGQRRQKQKELKDNSYKLTRLHLQIYAPQCGKGAGGRLKRLDDVMQSDDAVVTANPQASQVTRAFWMGRLRSKRIKLPGSKSTSTAKDSTQNDSTLKYGRPCQASSSDLMR
jgi:hypothetical protein